MTDRRWSSSVRVFAGAATALVAIALLLFLAVGGEIAGALAWVDGLGWAAAPLFVLLFAIEVVILVPGIVFPLAAGFFFGWAEGTLLSVLGKVLGATCAFLLARRLLARGPAFERAQALVELAPRLRLLAEVVPRGGWRTVALVRLVPLVPFKLSNYAFGWSGVSMRDFLVGTLLGTVPYSLTNAYIGSAFAGRSFAELGRSRTAPGAGAPWWISAAVAVIASAAAVAVARRSLRVLRETAAEDGAWVGADPPPADRVTRRGAEP